MTSQSSHDHSQQPKEPPGAGPEFGPPVRSDDGRVFARHKASRKVASADADDPDGLTNHMAALRIAATLREARRKVRGSR